MEDVVQPMEVQNPSPVVVSKTNAPDSPQMILHPNLPRHSSQIGDLDQWIETLRGGQHISLEHVKQLCSMVILLKKFNLELDYFFIATLFI